MADDIRLGVGIDDKATDGVGRLRDELGRFKKRSDKTASGWSKNWKQMSRDVDTVHSHVKKFASSVPVLLGGVGIGGAMGVMVNQGIRMNAELQSIETQFGVILGDAEKTKKVMGDIVKFSAETPFQLKEVANAGKILESFGLGGIENLRRVGDAAAAAGRPIEEIALTMGRIKSGAFGEAFMRLAETGLATREMLELRGLKFNKGGQFTGSVDEAMTAVGGIFQDRFGGMMEKMSQTWDGAMSTLKDNWNLAMAALLRPTFEKLMPKIGNLTALINDMTQTDRFRRWSSAVAIGLGGFVDLIGMSITFLSENSQLIEILGAGVLGLVTVYGSVIVATKAWAAAEAAKNAIMAANPTTLIIAGIAAVVGIVYKAVDATIGWASAWDFIVASGKSAWAWMKAFWNSTKAAVKFAIKDFEAFGTFVVEAVVATFQTAWDVAKTFWDNQKQAVRDAGSVFVELGKLIWKAISFDFDGVKQAWSGLKTALADAMNNALEVGQGLVERASERMGVAAGKAFGTEAGAEFRATVVEEWRQAGEESAQAFAEAQAGLQVSGGGSGGETGEATPSGTGESPAVQFGPSMEGYKQHLEEMKLQETAFQEFSKELWSGYWGDLTQLAEAGFSDGIATSILDSGASLTEQLDEIWSGMKESFVRMTVDMATAWVFSKARMAIASALFEKTATAEATKGALKRIAVGQVEAGQSKTEAAADVGSAGAKIFKAHSGIPFVGPLIAAGLVAVMVGALAKLFKGSFAGGGIIPGGGSGIEDNQIAAVSGGEFITSANRVREPGVLPVLQAIQRGEFLPQQLGGGLNLSLTIGDGSGITEEDLEEELIPLIEDWVDQRKLKL